MEEKLKGKKCGCGIKAYMQTVRGMEAEKRGDLPQNFGYFCKKCYEIGWEEEQEAMYGECRFNCKC